jgi:pimeloyl-ACP methyl ester carboxylesterase
MMHGMGDDAVYPLWPWIEALTARGIAVLSVDWDGHGHGGTSTLSFDRAPRSVGTILGRLFERTLRIAPLRACVAVGFSTGAALVLAAAARDRDARRHIASIVAVSPAVTVGPTVAGGLELLAFADPDAWRADLAPAARYYGRAGLVPAFGSFRRGDFPIRLEQPGDYPGKVRDFANATFASGSAIRAIDADVLWIHGRRDHVVPYEAARMRMKEARRLTAWSSERGHLRTSLSGELATRVASHVAGLAPFLEQPSPLRLASGAREVP